MRSSLKLVSILRDESILEQARIEAVNIVAKDPELDSNPALARAVQSLIDQARAEFVKKS
jgi:ATP-dependent DNA helicase RecG